jgi:hypothetical protein
MHVKVRMFYLGFARFVHVQIGFKKPILSPYYGNVWFVLSLCFLDLKSLTWFWCFDIFCYFFKFKYVLEVKIAHLWAWQRLLFLGISRYWAMFFCIFRKNIVLTPRIEPILVHLFSHTHLFYAWLTNNLVSIHINNMFKWIFILDFWFWTEIYLAKMWWFIDNRRKSILDYWSLHDFQHVHAFGLFIFSLVWEPCCWVQVECSLSVLHVIPKKLS